MADRYLSTVTIDGLQYSLRDDDARELIAAIQGGILSFIVSTNAATTPYGVKWGDPEVTGTLQPSSTTVGKIYLVPATSDSGDVYAEYVTVSTGASSYAWERLGTTNVDLTSLGDLAYKDSVTLSQHTTTIKNISAAAVTSTAVSVTPSTTHLSISSASDTTSTAITELGTASTDTFVKSYPGSTNNLVTTSIVPTDGTVSVPVVTIDNAAVSIPNVTSAGTASTWAFSTNEINAGSGVYNLTISGANGTAPTLGTAITASKVSQGTAISAAKVGSATTVATGSVSSSGTGGAVLVGLGSATTGSAVTGYEAPTTGSFVTASGTPSIVTGATGTEVMTGVASAALTAGGVTLTSTDVAVLDTQTDVVVS